MEATPLPEHIVRDKQEEEKAFKYSEFVESIINHVRGSEKLRGQIHELLTLDPDKLDELDLRQMDKYLLLAPKALIWIQDRTNQALIDFKEASEAFEDIIIQQASLLKKKDFDVSQISSKMREAKVADQYPVEYKRLLKEKRTRETIYIRLDGQVKHLERLNDNLKKIRESFLIKQRKDRGDTVEE